MVPGNDEPAPFPPEELERLGLYDPSAGDAAERLELIRYVMALGATMEEVAAASSSLGALALDLNLRPAGRSPLDRWSSRCPSNGRLRFACSRPWG